MSGTVRGAWLAAVVFAATALGAVLPHATGLVEQTYPVCSISEDDDLDEALIDARLVSAWEDPPLFQNVRAVLSVTVIYGPALDLNPNIEIACENEAWIADPDDEWDIDELSSSRQGLGNAQKLADGSRALNWRWAMTPRSHGTLVFQVNVQPIVIVNNKETRQKRRNEPVTIDVRVHENAEAVARVASAADELATVVPRLRVDTASEVSAELPMLGHEDVVDAEILLNEDAGSIPMLIQPETSTLEGGELRQTWSVEPAEAGVARLVFTTRLTATAGDQPVEQSVDVGIVREVPTSWWDRLQAFLAVAALVLGLVVAGLGIHHQVGKGRGDAVPPGKPADDAPAG